QSAFVKVVRNKLFYNFVVLSCDDFQSFKTFSNPLFEKQDDFPSRNDESILKEEVHEEALKSYLNPLFEDDEEIISNEVSSILSPKIDVKTIVSFFAPIGNCVRKWATSEVGKDNVEVSHEVFKSNNENDLISKKFSSSSKPSRKAISSSLSSWVG
ncbi:hypothetical protein Tco_1514339, partial [Tanacetum coccineum]